MVYDKDDNITELYDNKGAFLKFNFKNDRLYSAIDKRGRIVKYNCDEKLNSIIYPDGEIYEIKYSSNRIASITSKSTQWEMSYTDGKLTTIMEKRLLPVSATVSEIKINYGTNNTKLSYLDGSEEFYKFDSKNNITYFEEKDSSLNSNNTSYTYENNETGKKVTAVTYSAPDYTRAKVSIKQYNDIELPVSEIEDWQNISDTVKVKTETVYEYDINNNLISETVTKYTDKSGTITQTKVITNYSYNAQGSLVITENYVEGEELTTGKNFKQTIYDDDGNVVKTILWNSLESSSKFYTESDRAENGQVIADRDETGEVSAEYDYIANSNTVNSVRYPNGSKFAYGRNPYNDKITSVSQCTEYGEENTTDIVYADGLPVKVKSGNTMIEYTYEGKGRKKTVTVNGVLQSEYSYEDYKQTSPDDVRYAKKSQTLYTGVQSYKCVYLKEGTLNDDEHRFDAYESLTIGKDRLYLKNYDVDGILTDVTYKTATDERIVVYEYDNYHNLIKAETKNTSGTNILSESFTYNEYGEVTTKSLTGEVTQTYSYAYKNNAARSLDYITFGNYKFKPLTDVNGRNTGKEIYSGENKVAAEYITYRKVGDHATNMPATVWFGNGSQIKDSIKYKYDSCGNICQITENGHVIAKYSYDSLNRLIREDNKLIGKTTVFTYDQNGNITERCVYDYTAKCGEELSEQQCEHYSFDCDGDKLVNYNGETFAYNNLGCPTTYRGKTCEWQYGKYLTKLGETTFAYDGLGRRTSKGDITFTYDSDGRLLKQSNGLEFVYDNAGLAGIKHIGTQYFYRKDAQGNIVALLDSNGNVVVKYVYDAWGNNAVTDKDGNDISEVDEHIGNLNPFRYRGYYYDIETGMYYLQTRYYDPEVGRFISQDSIDYADPETINGLNLYAYCGNNPVMNVDPTGHLAISILIGLIIGAIVGATVGGYVAGKRAYENGARGWELFGWTLLGVVGGGFVGGATGAFIGWAAPGIGSFLGSSFKLGSFALAGGGSINVSITGGQAIADALGLLVLLAQWKPDTWPGDDPTIPPGDDFVWRGPGEVGSKFGEWYNPITHDQLHPDLQHALPKGPHWGWRNKILKIFKDLFK